MASKSVDMRWLTRYLVRVAMLSAVATIFMYTMQFKFFAPFTFLKFDFADVPVVIAALAMGPWTAVIVALVKCLLYLPMATTMGIGVLSNFICATALALIIGYGYRYLRRILGARRQLVAAIVASVVGVAGLVVVACLSNWFIVFPVYAILMNYDVIAKFGTEAIWAGIVPFNILKGGMQIAIAIPLYKVLDRIVFGNNNNSNEQSINYNQGDSGAEGDFAVGDANAQSSGSAD